MTRISEFRARAWSGFVGLMRQKLHRPSIGRVLSWVSIFGVIVLVFILGALWMYYEGPGASVLDDALVGGKAVMERGVPQPTQHAGHRTSRPGVVLDQREKTFDGFTLITTTMEAAAILVDMEGQTVHKWALPFSKAMPHLDRADALGDDKVHWFCGHVFANGDLLVVYQSAVDTPAGYGLAKLDKDSKLLWSCGESIHHSLDVGEDGRIYALTHRNSVKPPPGLASIHAPFVDDSLLVLSPEGKEIKRIRMLEAFRDSPFALTLSIADSLHMPARPMPFLKTPPMPFNDGAQEHGVTADVVKGAKDGPGRSTQPARAPNMGDPLHVNSIRVLNPSLAPKFPMFRANQVLMSLRSTDTIAVVDVEKGTVTWSAQGLWKSQHCPEFLENGRLLIYDNSGSRIGTRVLEYDPKTGATPWCYANEKLASFFAPFRGMAHRLPNGNTLVVDPDGMRIFEVTEQREPVWEMGCQPPEGEKVAADKIRSVTSARRYAPSQLAFLKGDIHARP